MGLFSAIQSLGYKAYNGLKTIGSGVGSAVHKIAGVANHIDSVLDGLSDVPILGGISDAVRDNIIYRTVLEGVQTVDEGVSFLEEGGIAGLVENLSPGFIGDTSTATRDTNTFVSPLF
jgi:hypothetical protein